MNALLVFLQVVATWLLTDFISGLFHWLEDRYGNPFWPIFGRHVTKPNILHHYIPRAFVTNSWFLSSRLLLGICALTLITTVMAGVFTWHVALALAIGANANQVHKWSHRTRHENGRVVVTLQRLRLIQSPRHHHRHHVLGKDSHYCVLTDFLNPVLDRTHFWRGLEWMIQRVTGVAARDDEATAVEVLRREPHFFGSNLELMRQRVGVRSHEGSMAS